jgi:hypothetical protein
MNKNTTPKPVGRPALDIKFPAGAFTINELHALNPQAKWSLTIRQHVQKQLKAGWLTKLPKTRPTGGVGKPADLFIRTAMFKAAGARKAARAALNETPVAVDVVTPVVEATPETLQPVLEAAVATVGV